MTQTKTQLRDEIDELVDEIEQSQLNLIGSIRDDIEETPDTKAELEELLRNVQREFDNQNDLFVRTY